ncbi:MAG: hypothetical protein U9Q66_04365 [Patescibacteria group bacterium]|nr:hypothetical protein [Patescibacteria group bacterium]
MEQLKNFYDLLTDLQIGNLYYIAIAYNSLLFKEVDYRYCDKNIIDNLAISSNFDVIHKVDNFSDNIINNYE